MLSLELPPSPISKGFSSLPVLACNSGFATVRSQKCSQAHRAWIAKLDVVALAKDPQAVLVGQKLFLNYCAQCHASDAGGSRGFPNLTDKKWLWG